VLIATEGAIALLVFETVYLMLNKPSWLAIIEGSALSRSRRC